MVYLGYVKGGKDIVVSMKSYQSSTNNDAYPQPTTIKRKRFAKEKQLLIVTNNYQTE